MELIEMLKSSEQTKTADTYRRYVQILEVGVDDPKDLAELQDCMRALGKSTSDVEADQRVLKQARDEVSRIARGTGLDGQIDKSIRACEKHAAETIAIKSRREQEYRELFNAQTELQEREMAASSAGRRLRSLKAQNGDLLAHIAPPVD